MRSIPRVVPVTAVLVASVAACAAPASTVPLLHVAGVPEHGPIAAYAAPSASVAGYRLVGSLPDGPDHAAVWRWPDTSVTEQDVAELAQHFGLTAAPDAHRYGWVVTSPAGELRVRRDTGLWAFTRTPDCPPYVVDVDDPLDAGSGVACAVATAADLGAQPTPRTPNVAQARTAIAGIRAFLHLGEPDVDIAGDVVHFVIDPVVGGFPTWGMATRLDVDAVGIVNATGWLTRPIEGPVYPLRSAQAAFDDLARRPIVAPAIACPLATEGNPATEGEPATGGEPVPEGEPATGRSRPEPPAPMPLPMPVCRPPQPVIVTGAHLGLQLDWDQSSPAGVRLILLPAWFFTIRDAPPTADVLPVIAVAAAYLAPAGTEATAPPVPSDAAGLPASPTPAGNPVPSPSSG